MNRCRHIAVFLLCIGLATAAQAFPDHPVHIVVGFAPGGADISARLVAQKLSVLWDQPVIIENRAGAAGNIAAALVAKAAPDGYTILLLVNSYTINTTVYRNLTWDLLRDFAPIGRYASTPMVVLVNDQLPVKTFADFLAYAKANPGKINYGSAGSGTTTHLAGEMFDMRSGVQMTHVPYKGSGPSVVALLSNEVQLSFGSMAAFDGLIKQGRIRPLAVTTATRFSGLPDVPTLAESGMPGFDVNVWYGLVAPLKTPPAIIKKISDDLAKVMADPDLAVKLRATGLEPSYLDSKKTGELMKQDVSRWREVINKLKFSLE
ncbi:tripartite tricarboxylate transporter substrate binding protein [Glaciimonas sp. CA11.2]|uniref:Bug family tripartite tricarboxylate transporter substrate binding protein n=1 Tax=unclassified Glaciimonas TaxID=2644401 RepID=UPI002AB4D526|nr:MULTISPECIES: tripartite tricarboxylate transporter substrate binding protein [unclassified Glaciimonas]MDY7548468.1 tripartite tricarboxylate transporter substrate binding protein [Glaciimonas sp. CA11.2]MEB0010383.1 tripartite tricarboxylate transporter substrate binding protein [Glaciimonas sp. Cout2]MEB0084740.1 tripartite tricarboxylate transporter substrate binding protein [Glaciimonas sp. Gout2]MEB0165238.1 tripartite tricarboxylate transporter substrate binding protein [Glaciimonas s